MGASEERAGAGKAGMKVPLSFTASEGMLVKEAAAGKPLGAWCKARVLAGLGNGHPPVDPEDPSPPDPGAGPVPTPKPDAVRGRNLAWRELKAGTDYVECKIKAPNNEGVPPNVRIFDSEILPCGLDWSNFYLNNGLQPKPTGLRLVRCEMVDPTGRIEIKASDVQLIGVFSKGKPWGVKLRHGEDLVVRGCKNLGEVTLRDVRHRVVDCPGAKVALFAGNHPADYAQWSKTRIPGGGHNMYASADCYIEGVGSVIVGFGGDTQVKAKNHVIHPDLRAKTDLRAEQGTRFEARGARG